MHPLLPIARAAATAGHEVLISAAASLEPLARDAGLPFTPSGPDLEPQHTALRPVDAQRDQRVLREHFAGRLAHGRAVDLLPALSRFSSDVVLRDELDFGAAVSAECLGVPVASVVVLVAGGFLQANAVAVPLAQLRATQGLPAEEARTLGGSLVVAPFAPRLRDPPYPLPLGTHHFDPQPDRARGSAVTGHALLGQLTGRPIVYVTLRTIYNTESGDLFSRILTGLSELPLDVIATVGRTVQTAQLGPQPANVHLHQYLPQMELLPHCAAAITHGGSVSVTGALRAGVPLVCLPLGADGQRRPLRGAWCRCDAGRHVADARPGADRRDDGARRSGVPEGGRCSPNRDGSPARPGVRR